MTIVVITKNWLGDVILANPAFKAIKANDPNARLIVLSPRRCSEILRYNPFVDEVISFDERREQRSLISKIKLIIEMRKRKIDRLYLFHPSGTRARLAYLMGARERVGYNTKGRSAFLTHSIPEPKGPMHDVQYFLELLKGSGLRTDDDYRYEFYFSGSHQRHAKELVSDAGLTNRKVVAIHPGANWVPKRWPPAYFKALAHRLVDRYGVGIVITGSAEDAHLASTIQEGPRRSSIFSLCGRTSLCELGALFALCRLVISNDTGPLHIATGVGTNVVGLFGPTAPRETAPLGKGRNIVIHYAPRGVKLPWFGKHFPYGDWMEHISVDEVMHTIKQENLLDADNSVCVSGGHSEAAGNAVSLAADRLSQT